MGVKLLCIPQPRLGDAFYVSLFLEVLRERGHVDQARIACPAHVEWVYRLFSLEPVCVRSSLLGKGCGGGLAGEIAFIRALRESGRECRFLRITNDFVEALQQILAGIPKARGAGLGNFFLRTGGGLRYQLSRWTAYKRSGEPNPLHFIHRLQCLADTEFEEITQGAWYAAFGERCRKALADVEASDLSGHIVLFPETSKAYKNLRESQVSHLLSRLHGLAPVVVVHSGARDWHLPGDVREVTFAEDLQAGFRYVKRSSLVVTADSFPAHFSPYFAERTLIVYNQDREHPSCEGWGVPLHGVVHFEAGICHALNADYSAVEVVPEDSFTREALMALRAERKE